MTQKRNKDLCLEAARQQAEVLVHLLLRLNSNELVSLAALAKVAAESAAQWLGLFIEDEP